jgi:hypothetical protein
MRVKPSFREGGDEAQETCAPGKNHLDQTGARGSQPGCEGFFTKVKAFWDTSTTKN